MFHANNVTATTAFRGGFPSRSGNIHFSQMEEDLSRLQGNIPVTRITNQYKQLKLFLQVNCGKLLSVHRAVDSLD